jgi:hypothetical protein
MPLLRIHGLTSWSKTCGDSDDGRDGIKDFLAKHTCNAICRALDLKHDHIDMDTPRESPPLSEPPSPGQQSPQVSAMASRVHARAGWPTRGDSAEI